MLTDSIESTVEVQVPKEALGRVIGQSSAVEKVKIAVRQSRHVLLVGAPGTGKSMIAKAMSECLPKPKQQVVVYHNDENPQNPLIEIVSGESAGESSNDKPGMLVDPVEVPSLISERLGFRCGHCGGMGSPKDLVCNKCGGAKIKHLLESQTSSHYNRVFSDVFELGPLQLESEVYTTRVNEEGVEEPLVYRREGGRIRVLDKSCLEKLAKARSERARRVLIPAGRNNFVQATGASETELLGDVRHDPYGSHPEIGTPSYLRVVPGAVHLAHEGILFVDELPQLGSLQSYILTAMQEKKFPITGRNPHSSGSAVRVEAVPCDFLFVGACNIANLSGILSPLRSRINGGGYEILLDSTMKDTPENRDSLVRFVAQEIILDGRIPHARVDAILAVIDEASKRARVIDEEREALTLRLRDLGGVVRLAGDMAVVEGAGLIEKRHVERALKDSTSIEQQLREKYGSVFRGLSKDSSVVVGDSTAERGYG
ncbi:MAG TPA: Lon protease family protein [Candidatus Altiarchaeales archaeon]|nr:Lon protease family protein [Candidatus Altiarchaeales archaeon]